MKHVLKKNLKWASLGLLALPLLIIVPKVYAQGVQDLLVHFDLAGGDSWINTGGNLGIGTLSPTNRLSVHSDSNFAARFTSVDSDVRLAFPGHGIFVKNAEDSNGYLLQLNHGDGIVFQVTPDWATLDGNFYVTGGLNVNGAICLGNC